jgi:hypothetical protein
MRTAVVLFLLVPLGLMAMGRTLAATQSVQVSVPRPGRVFFVGEPVTVGLKMSTGTGAVGYALQDFEGRQMQAGTAALDATSTVAVDFGVLGAGWYRLDLTLPGGTAQTDALAVLPPMADGGRHYRMFGVCATLDSQDQMDFLSLAGMRANRLDWGWPTIEPTAGGWAPGDTQRAMTRAREAGMEFIPIVGYSPRYVGVKPLDATSGRVSIAWHTWAIHGMAKWAGYLRWCQGYAATLKPVQWPPYRLAPDAVRRQSMNAIAAWEVWNEADQNYYYGPWDQYCDFLRVAHDVLETREQPVIYGGSCGHWTETGMAYSSGLRTFFDMAAGHAGHEVDATMPDWLYGAYSIGWKYGMPYQLAITEGYFKYEAQTIHAAMYVLPYIAKLRHWGAPWQYKGVGWVSMAQPDFTTDGYCYVQPYGIVPTPAYVATAVARYWLTDASYVGRIRLGEAEAYVFLRPRPLLMVWKEGAAASMNVRALRGAQVIDFLGRTAGQAEGGSAAITAGWAPVMVADADWSYVADAAAARLTEFTTSQFGVAPRTSKWCAYIGKLADDVRSLAGKDFDGTVSAMRSAIEAVRSGPGTAYPRLAVASGKLNSLIAVLAGKASNGKGDGKAYNALLRVLWVAEWFDEWADDVARAAGQRDAGAGTIGAARTEQVAAWAAAVQDDAGWEKPRARSLARRAGETLATAQASGGNLLAQLVRAEARAAIRWAATEKPIITHVLGLAEFATADQVVKMYLLDPGKPQTIELYLLNETARTLTAHVKAKFPEGWQPGAADIAAQAPPHSMVKVGEVQVTLPASEPWVQKNVWRPSTPLSVTAPAQLPANQGFKVWAEVGGVATASTEYFFGVGRYQ